MPRLCALELKLGVRSLREALFGGIEKALFSADGLP